MNKGLTHVKAGDPLEIRAPVWNAMLDAARDRQARGHATERTPGPDFRGVPILIKNNSGADRSQYDILGVSGVVFAAMDDGFKQRIVLTGVTPATGSHEGKFAVLAEPIGDGDIGSAVVDGTTICQVNITDAAHEFADIANGDAAKLVSGETGPTQIIWIESGTGTKWAVVRIGNKAVEGEALTGEISAYAGNTVPDGYLLCDGAEVSKTTYADLFAALDDGAGGGLWDNSPSAGNFNVPALGGLTLRGWIDEDAEFDPVGAKGGVAVLDLEHTHGDGHCTGTAEGSDVWAWDGAATGITTWQGTRNPPAIDRPDQYYESAPHEIDNRGPWGCVKWIIKT